MFNKISKFCATMLLSAGLVGLSAAPAAAFFGFCFGMDSSGPFMSFRDNGRSWHFNSNHPFGYYNSMYNRRGYRAYYRSPRNNNYGYGNGYFQNPYAGQFPYAQNRHWRGGWGRVPPGYGMAPWRGYSPWNRGPFGGF